MTLKEIKESAKVDFDEVRSAGNIPFMAIFKHALIEHLSVLRLLLAVLGLIMIFRLFGVSISLG